MTDPIFKPKDRVIVTLKGSDFYEKSGTIRSSYNFIPPYGYWVRFDTGSKHGNVLEAFAEEWLVLDLTYNSPLYKAMSELTES